MSRGPSLSRYLDSRGVSPPHLRMIGRIIMMTIHHDDPLYHHEKC